MLGGLALLSLSVLATGRLGLAIVLVSLTPPQATGLTPSTIAPSNSPTPITTATPFQATSPAPPPLTPTLNPFATVTPFPGLPLATAWATPFGGGTGLIAFVSERTGNSEIYRLRLDGSELRS